MLRQNNITEPAQSAFPPCPIAFRAQGNPSLVAVRTQLGEISYAELHHAIEIETDRLKRFSGRTIVLAEPNSIGLIVTLFAGFRLGCLVILLNPKHPQQEIDAILSSNKATRPGVTSSPDGDLEPFDGTMPLLNPAAPATAMLTSGSTGKPSLIVHSISNHLASAASSAKRLDLGPGKSWLLSLPCFHVGGLAILWRCFTSGMAVQLMENGQKLIGVLKSAPPTILSLVPTQLQDLIETDFRCPTAIQDVIVGGATVHHTLLTRALELGYPVRTSYGLTETSSMITLSNRWELPVVDVHAGTPLEGQNVRITENGLLAISSETVFQGWLEKGKLVARTHKELETADLAVFTKDGCLKIEGRTDRVIISGGENVSLRNIEAGLLSHSNVSECRAIGVQDPRFGMRPVAFVSLKNKAGHYQSPNRLNPASEGTLKDHLSKMLPKFAIPDHILPLPLILEGAVKITHQQLLDLATSSQIPS